MFTVFWLLLDDPKCLDITRLKEEMSARLKAIAETKTTTVDEFQTWLDIERRRRTAVLNRFAAHVTERTQRESQQRNVASCASPGKCVLKEGWASYDSQAYTTGSLSASGRSVVDLLAFAEDCIRHCMKTVEEYGLCDEGVTSVKDDLPSNMTSLLRSCADVMDALQHTRGRLLGGELTVTCVNEVVMGSAESERSKASEELDTTMQTSRGIGTSVVELAPAPHPCSSLKAVGKKDKERKKSKAEKKKDSREHHRSGSENAKTERTSRRKHGSKVSVPSSQRVLSKLKECNESPPSTPAPRSRASGAENRLPRAPEKRSWEDEITKVHRRTKKRISYKKDTMVDMIDLRGSDDMHSGAREEAEEEHDDPSSEKSDREDDNASRDKVDDSETSHGHPRDTDEADDDGGGSDDGTAHEESDDGGEAENKATQTRLEAKEAEWEAKLKEMATVVERLAATKVIDWTEQSRCGIQGKGVQGLFGQEEAAEASRQEKLGKVFLDPDEAETRKKANKGCFEFKAPTELASQQEAPTSPSPPMEALTQEPQPAPEEEGAVEESLAILLDAQEGTLTGAMKPPQFEAQGKGPSHLDELVAAMKVDMPTKEPQEQRTPEHEPEMGELRAQLGSWAIWTDSGGPTTDQRQQEATSQPTRAATPQTPRPREGEEAALAGKTREGRPLRLDTPEFRPEEEMQPGESSAEGIEGGDEGPWHLPQSHEVGKETRGTPLLSGTQKKKKRFQRKSGATCFDFLDGVHRALDCPKFLKNKVEWRVNEEDGKMYDKQGRVVERAPDGAKPSYIGKTRRR
ncbi:hypothetical protein CBR_g38918 [Chara braunii]|uniref:Uncharacterized protein n=1 Tax=Chara braunii TaxID=69332 RepID=A0A388LQM8_CHABU|nr:hypothetical protein CBR_g38918 [Chara braunii]|eukprot:GBG84636.1 hypothetical protein CBR_g38918 [Chara braunii]